MAIQGRKSKMGLLPQEGVQLHANAIYTLAGAAQALSLPAATVGREVRKRRLRASKICGRYVTTGAWLLEWIVAGDEERRWRLERPDGEEDDGGLTQ